MNILWRQPFSILGGLGILGLISDLIQWKEQLGQWIDAWRTFSHAVADLLLGWLVIRLPWTLPDWWQDYAAMGIIVAGATTRTVMAGYRGRSASGVLHPAETVSMTALTFAITALWCVVLWPVAILGMLTLAIDKVKGAPDPKIFFESFCWAALVVAINYTLLKTT